MDFIVNSFPAISVFSYFTQANAMQIISPGKERHAAT